MSSAFGHRPTGKAKQIGSGILGGLAALGQAMNDGPLAARIEEIDREIEHLTHERDACIDGMYEPGDLKRSSIYDPHWVKPVDDEPRIVSRAPASEGRLTECEGLRYSGDRRIHPGCPYPEKLHNEHTFTLRD